MGFEPETHSFETYFLFGMAAPKTKESVTCRSCVIVGLNPSGHWPETVDASFGVVCVSTVYLIIDKRPVH
jgi:hypothetical protein